MKTIKLNKLQANLLSEREMKYISGAQAATGGGLCGCGCCYAGNGGSSTVDNACANADHGYHSPNC